MNDKLLIGHKINFPFQNINFMSFLHPNFIFINDIESFENISVPGIIYTGRASNDLIHQLNDINHNWVAITNYNYDLDLTTNEELIKNLLPIHYIKMKNTLKPEEFDVFNKMNYNVLLEQIKISLITNAPLVADFDEDQSIYDLFTSILSIPKILDLQYFTIVNSNNINIVASALLTFLIKVQTLNTENASPAYARLIIQSNKRYGKQIQSAIKKYIKSKCNKQIALYNLLSDLNRAK